MENNTSYTRAEFLVTNIFYAAVMYFVYNSQLLRCIEGMSLAQSRWILAGVLLLFAAGSAVFLKEKQRTEERCKFNVIIPFGLYTCVTYYSVKPELFHIVGIAFAVLLLIYAVMMLRWKPALTEQGKRRRKLPAFLRGTRMLARAGMLGIMSFFFVNLIFTSTLLHSHVKPEANTENTVAVSMKMLSKLKMDVWETLSVHEKMDVLQMIANVECSELGLPHELNVTVREVRDEDTLGYYNDATHQITVDLTHLQEDFPWEVVDTICHEAYHAYQYRQVEVYQQADEELQDLMMFNTPKQYRAEFRNYQDGDDFDLYYEQLVEENAREYAEYETEWYYDMLYDEVYG